MESEMCVQQWLFRWNLWRFKDDWLLCIAHNSRINDFIHTSDFLSLIFCNFIGYLYLFSGLTEFVWSDKC